MKHAQAYSQAFQTFNLCTPNIKDALHFTMAFYNRPAVQQEGHSSGF